MIDFSTCLVPCDPVRMDPSFISKLEDMQNFLGQKLIINTAYRSPEYELSHGRSGKSTHCEGRAVDVHCTDTRLRHQMVAAAIEVGILSIGIYKTFLHFDCGSSRTSPIIWIG